MNKIEIRYDVEANPDEVFAFLTDFNRLLSWRTLDDIKLEPEGTARVGTILRTKVKGIGRPMKFTNEITELDSTRRKFQDRGIDGTFIIQSGWLVEPNASGSRINWLTEFEAHGPLVLLTPVLRRAIRSVQLKDLAKLNQLLERDHSKA
jgi:carbon monoxide dehydrogenase subunit G